MLHEMPILFKVSTLLKIRSPLKIPAMKPYKSCFLLSHYGIPKRGALTTNVHGQLTFTTDASYLSIFHVSFILLHLPLLFTLEYYPSKSQLEKFRSLRTQQGVGVLTL